MRTQTFIVSMASALVFAGAANADYVLQTFTGSQSASASVNRANANTGFQTGGFTLNYNAIAGGASTMGVDVYNEATGSTKTDVPYTQANGSSSNPTNAANHGTYSNGYSEGTGGNTKYYKNYYGGYSTSSPFTANDNYRAWGVNGTVGAQVQSSFMNLSSSSSVDCGIADWTQVRYTGNSTGSTYSTIQSVNVQARSDSAGSVYTQGGSGLAYSAVTGQVMDLSSATGFSGIQLKGAGTAWAIQGAVEFSFTDVNDNYSNVSLAVGGNQLMGDFTVTVADLLASNAVLDLAQIKSFTIDFYDGQNSASGRGATSYNGGFSYDASQVNLLGYAVPAPGAMALLGAAGLIGARRRRD